MTIRGTKDAWTGTCSGKLSTSHRTDNDEMFAYIEITERLMTARPKPPVIEPSGCYDKNSTLPMRKSLFAHVPPYIIFRDNRTTATLPPEITNHLLWWQTKKHYPRVVVSTVRKSGFTITAKTTGDWCGTWCNRSACNKLKSPMNFRKVNQYPGSDELSDKISLWRNVQRMMRRHNGEEFNFMPLAYVLPEEREGLKKFMLRNGGTWILKPPNSCAGCGIKIVSRWYEIPDERSFIAQRYVSNPRLIDGIKFDLRLYVLLTSINPLRIYVYNEGLVRLATVEYMNHSSTLFDKFMHLTNTSVNKASPNFRANDDPNKCEGNIWSLNCLWKYLNSIDDVDTIEIWNKIKDIAIKTIISAESTLTNAFKKTSMVSPYNFYQLFGFDVLLDEQYRPWLLEVNDCPSMERDTPLCGILKGQLAKDYLSLVGFHVPNVLTDKELRTLRGCYGDTTFCYDQRLYSGSLTVEEKRKQYAHSKMATREAYLKTILKYLTRDDVRVLIRHEDEITRVGGFEAIFPTRNTYEYFRYFDEIRYYDLLLDAWENEYRADCSKGIDRLKRLCKKKYHLS